MSAVLKFFNTADRHTLPPSRFFILFSYSLQKIESVRGVLDQSQRLTWQVAWCLTSGVGEDEQVHKIL